VLAMLAAMPLVSPAQSGNPTNKADCVRMTRGPLETQCRGLFANPSQKEQQAACLQQVQPQLETVCEQFFGASSDFCSTCTSSCNQAFKSGDGKRRECLSMCLQQPGCK